MKRLISFSLVLVVVLSLCLRVPMVSAAGEQTASDYYYNQLATADARKIYGALCDMLADGSLKTGVRSIDLVADGILANQTYVKEALMADFSSARDAFMLDHSDIFYVDFDKLSVTYIQESETEVSVLLGVGRDTTYLRQGFSRSDVDSMVADFDAQVADIVSQTGSQHTMEGKLKAAYDAVVARISYALEANAEPENVDYVRTPYGALVRGQSVCEGYARALKAVLDEMGFVSVLVQGTFVDEQGAPQPHMWNYVRMDDNRWYLLDATMEDGNAASDDEFFLLSLDALEILRQYQPNGVISLSQNSFEFNYPPLSVAAYQELSDAFTASVEGYYQQVSYKGMGMAKTKDMLGLEIVGSHDGKNWFYAWNHMICGFMDLGYGAVTPADMGMDTETAFSNLMEYAYVGVTSIEAPAELPNGNPTPDQRREFYTYTGGIADIDDLSKVSEVKEYDAVAPYVAAKSPSQLKPGQSYHIKAVYSESLKLTNAASAAGIQWVTPVANASIDNFTWDGDKTVEFDLTTATNFGYTTFYYFDLVNLSSSADSNVLPDPICYTVVNYPSFDCPKVSWDYSHIHANTPALIADSNLAATNWMDANGDPIANYASNRLALVATEMPEDDGRATAIEAINGGKEVLASKTYDISMTLCSGQVSYITGNKVKVYVPFPEGYNAASGVSFKAYHFKSDGTPEEITCVTTENGIIMMCDAFSPFVVTATEKTAVSERQVMTFSSGNGRFAQDVVTVTPGGEPTTITIQADSGYRVDRILLNGEPIQDTGKVRTTGDTTAVTLIYDNLKDSGNVLEAEFVLEDIPTGDAPEVLANPVTSHYADASVTAPAGGWVVGSNIFTVTGEKAFLVVLTEDDGASYTCLEGQAQAGGFAYTAQLTADSKLLVVCLGDANLSGGLTAADVAMVNASVLNKRNTSALEMLVFDVNGDGSLTAADVARLNAVVLNKLDDVR